MKRAAVTFLPALLLMNDMLLIFFFTIFSTMVNAQDKNIWNGKECAVCLTYDDALKTQLDNVVPLLDSLALKATFYVPGFFPGFKDNMSDWKVVAQKGNELGNHTLFHPCVGNTKGRDWVKPDYDLSNYSVQRMVDEIEMANVLLQAVDGRTERTFAYPCGDIEAGTISYISKIKKNFAGARGAQGKMQKIDEIDLFDIGSYMINGESGDALISLVKKAMNNNELLVFLFHGVGGGHDINVSVKAHSILLYFLKQNEKDIWIAPLVDIAEYVTEYKE